MRRSHNAVFDLFQSQAWKETRSAYLEEHELCELCLIEKKLVLSEDVYLKLPPWTFDADQPIDHRNMIAVCKAHKRELYRKKNRKYSFDQEGNVIRERRASIS